MLRAIWSSQTQVTFMPPWQRSNLKVQRGTISQFDVAGDTAGMPMPV